MDAIIDALKQFFGEYVVASAILAIAFIYFVWWLSAKFHSMTSKVDGIDGLPCRAHEDSLSRLTERINESAQIMAQIKSRLETLPCPTHSERHDKQDERMNNTDALLHKMEGQLELLVNNSIEKGNKRIRNHAGHSFSAKHSPRTLNENGISLLNDLGGHEFLERNMDFFIAKIEALNPKTALDIEDLALAVLQTSTSHDMFIPIKNWIYNAPTRTIHHSDGTSEEKEVTLDDAIFVLSLPIRDEYLARHPL